MDENSRFDAFSGPPVSTSKKYCSILKKAQAAQHIESRLHRSKHLTFSQTIQAYFTKPYRSL
ncbi:Protein of unknown function [Pyronema omphalodes CBS 100304]|uniref:Uncharacterized protein n=1 Tax=Pyronema omphalodes (strain CBS 100304) TaxID=1076935 RepID=U4L193_PYROM|nr:Protein of unknown function [Pyronema omphalodes CBS 100304]